MIESFRILEEWASKGKKDKFTMKHLTEFFGKPNGHDDALRKHHCAHNFYRFLSRHLLEIIWDNPKVGNVLSYLIWLEKFTARLADPQLMYKLQFK